MPASDAHRSRKLMSFDKKGGWKIPQDEIGWGLEKAEGSEWASCAITSANTKSPDYHHCKQTLLGFLPHISRPLFGLLSKSTNFFQVCLRKLNKQEGPLIRAGGRRISGKNKRWPLFGT